MPASIATKKMMAPLLAVPTATTAGPGQNPAHAPSKVKYCASNEQLTVNPLFGGEVLPHFKQWFLNPPTGIKSDRSSGDRTDHHESQ